MEDIRIGNEHSRSQVGQVIDLLRGPRLWVPTERDYPDFGNWLNKTEAQLAADEKHAMAAFMEGKAVGAVIYRRNPESPTTLDIRNISISPDTRGRYFGAFLLRNAETEAQHDFAGIETITVDTKASNDEMLTFLASQGYSIEEIEDLYRLGTGPDVILTKNIA